MTDIENFEEAYNTIIEILKRYIIMTEENYKVVALWILGTYFHNSFRTYPYLYINASKGSGKTRLLKLISFLSKNGRVVGLPSEAFVFRQEGKMTFCFDEMEGLERKESHDLRLLLNSAYKQGLFVPRMKKNKEGDLVSEQFEAYAPISIANIWGMDDVLQDRCLTIILEKSESAGVTRMIEAWDREPDAISIKKYLEELNLEKIEINALFSVVKCSVVTVFTSIERVWNDTMRNIILETTLNNTSSSYNNTTLNNTELFNKAFASLDWSSGIYDIEVSKGILDFLRNVYLSGIDGRNLELYYPIVMMSTFINDTLYNDILSIAQTETTERKLDDILENKDSTLIYGLLCYIHNREENQFYNMTNIKNELVETIGEEIEQKDGSTKKVAPFWFNIKWLGRALKRMNLRIKVKRLASGREVMLNFEKIREKAKMLGLELPKVDIQADLKNLEV